MVMKSVMSVKPVHRLRVSVMVDQRYTDSCCGSNHCVASSLYRAV